MEDAVQAFITECLNDAIEQATTKDGISPDTDLMENDHARHHIGEQAFVNMMDTFEDLHTFTEAQDALIAEYMTDSRSDFPDTTDELIQGLRDRKLGFSDSTVLALGYRAAELFEQDR